MDRATETFIGATATDIRDVRVDVGVGRLRVLLQESDGRHDLTGLAPAALRHVLGKPRLLHRMLAVGRETFDRRDARALQAADRHRAGAHRLAVDVHGASAALRDAAAEFGAGETSGIADGPKQGCIWLKIDLMLCAIDGECDHRRGSSRTLLPKW